jgi:hypothetical protein
MDKIKKRTIFLLLGILIFINIFSVSGLDIEDRIIYLSPRLSALGGYHAALADDYTVLFTNPAGFRKVGYQLHASELTIGISGPIFDITSMIVEGTDNLEADELSDIVTGLHAALNVTGPVSFAYLKNGIGFGIFNWMELEFNNLGAGNLEGKVNENILINGGYSFRIPFPAESNSALDIGISCKTIIKGEVEVERSALELFDIFSDFSNILFSEPFELDIGIGFDLGVLYSYKDFISAGLVCRDIYSPIIKNNYTSLDGFFGDEEPDRTNTIIPPDLSLGILITPYLGRAEKYISNMKILYDYNDILDFVTLKERRRNILLHMGFGLEFTLLNILILRGGFNEGLMAAGIGLDLKAFNLNLSMYGTELSTEPGMHSIYNIVLGFDFTY